MDARSICATGQFYPNFDTPGGRGYNLGVVVPRAGNANEVARMARKKSKRRDWRVIVFVSISLIIVLSMVLSSILLAFPGN